MARKSGIKRIMIVDWIACSPLYVRIMYAIPLFLTLMIARQVHSVKGLIQFIISLSLFYFAMMLKDIFLASIIYDQ